MILFRFGAMAEPEFRRDLLVAGVVFAFVALFTTWGALTLLT